EPLLLCASRRESPLPSNPAPLGALAEGPCASREHAVARASGANADGAGAWIIASRRSRVRRPISRYLPRCDAMEAASVRLTPRRALPITRREYGIRGMRRPRAGE